MNEHEHESDYVWHFRFSEDEGERLHADSLAEMLRRQLKALLDCVTLTCNGHDLTVTGFRLLADQAREFEIYGRGTSRSGDESIREDR